MGNWSSWRPSAISAAAAMIASAFSGDSSPKSLFTCAQAPFNRPRARIWVRSRPRPEIGKFSTARWVWARHRAFAGTRTSPMVSCSMRYSVSAICRRPRSSKVLGQGVGGAGVAGEVDRRILVEFRQPVVRLDHPHGPGLRAHHDRLGGATTGVVAHPLEQITVGDPGGAEEDVLTGDQMHGGQHLVQVVAGIEGLLPLGVIFGRQLGLDLTTHAADRRRGDNALRGPADAGQHVGPRVGPARRDGAGYVAVGDQPNPGSGGAHVVDQL